MKEPGWKNIFQDEQGNVIPFGSPASRRWCRSSTARAW